MQVSPLIYRSICPQSPKNPCQTSLSQQTTGLAPMDKSFFQNDSERDLQKEMMEAGTQGNDTERGPPKTLASAFTELGYQMSQPDPR